MDNGTEERGRAPLPRLSNSFFIFLSAISAAALFIASPLAFGIAWGALFAFLWRPVHARVCRVGVLKRRPNLAAASSLLILIIGITIPMGFILQALARDLVEAYSFLMSIIHKIQDTGLPTLDAARSYLPEWAQSYIMPFLMDRERLISIISSAAQTTASFLRGLSGGLLQWTGAFIFQAAISLMTFFFMCRDGSRTVDYITALIPLPREMRSQFISHTGDVMNSVAYGTIITVAVQAILGGIGWSVAGLESAILASCAMFIFGMIPMGTAVVWLPGSIYLALCGMPWHALGLFLWGACVVSMIDSFLRPIFIGGGSSIPTFALMIGLTGGIVSLGLLGVFVGPLVMAVFLSAVDLYRSREV